LLLTTKFLMELKDKYIFRPYNPNFPKLFNAEKERLQKTLDGEAEIEHIGSTAVPGLGGKGVIDISVAVPKENWTETSEKLETLGYEYKKKDKERESQRLFLMADLPDEEMGTRIYHIHLTYPKSTELKREIGLRDYLRTHPEAVKEYADIKILAAKEAQKFNTKDEMRDTYGKIKEDFVRKILEKCGDGECK
jgi:GrpB-like predicted nucleotidyltransferase (UPF0157 family)